MHVIQLFDVYLMSTAAPMAELSGCDRNHLALKAQNSYSLTLYRKFCKPQF